MTIQLTGEKIEIKPMKEEDAEKLSIYSKEPKLNEFSGPYMASESIEKAKEYIEKCNKNIKEKKSYCFGIYNKESKAFVGTIGFFNIDENNKNGEIGFWIAKDYWNKGYMAEAVKLLTKYILNELNYHRIYAFFNKLNGAVTKILEKANYSKEGELIEALNYKGEYYNDIIYGIVKDNS